MICNMMHYFSPETLPLHGIRVIAIEHSVAGPLSTRMLGELGAEVIKIERPGAGDFARHWDHNVAGESAQFWWLNSHKKSVALDLKSESGRATLDTLLSGADVVIHNLAPASATRLGLCSDTLASKYPRLINCQISGFGASGPAADRKAYDMLIQAEAGLMSITGTPEQPMRVGVSISDVSTGLYAALLVLGALHERERTGKGRYLDVAMLDVSIEFFGPMLLSYANAGVVYPRIPDRHHAIAPYGVFECSDGRRILIAIEQDAEWQRFCLEVIKDPALAAHGSYSSNVDRVRHNDELAAHLAEHFKRSSSAEILAALDAANLAYAKINDVHDVLNHPVVVHRGIVETSATSDGRPVLRHVGIAERIFRNERDHGTRPPRLGEHTKDVVAQLGADSDLAFGIAGAGRGKNDAQQ